MTTFAKSKKVHFEYEILERLEAGFKLTGNETKSIRTQSMNLNGAFVSFHRGNAFLSNLHIPKYKYSTVGPEFDPERSRRLLLRKKQINYLRGKAQEKGLTIVPLSVYSKGNLIKVELGVARGKKLHDKRESIKKRDQKRDDGRYLKQSY